MNALLDTHAFLWFLSDSPRLSATARTLIENPDTQPFLSVGSLWEMSIKISLGKLSIAQPFDDFISQQLNLNGIALLGITLEHTAVLTALPFHHRDPFDRLLVAQAQTENLPIVSADKAFDAYGIQRIW